MEEEEEDFFQSDIKLPTYSEALGFLESIKQLLYKENEDTSVLIENVNELEDYFMNKNFA